MKKFLITIIIILLLLSIVHNVNTSYASNLPESEIDLFINKVEQSTIFKDYKDKMTSKEPYVLNDLLGENEEKVGYLAQYEIEIEKEQIIQDDNEEFILNTTVTSLLTFIYNEIKDSMGI